MTLVMLGNTQLSLFKIISLVLVVLCFIMMFLPWMTVSMSVSFYDYSESMNESANLFKISGSGSFWTVMLVIFEILFFLAMALAIFGILTDRSLLVMPVAVLAVLMFLFTMFACFWAKGQVNDLADYASYMSDYMSYGIHVGVGAWLFLVFGLGAYGVLFYEERTLGRNPFDGSQLSLSGVSMPKVNLGGVGGWTCSSCGAKMGANQSFCTSCGAKKPEPPRCPSCGKLLKTGEAFCSNCGTRVR